MSDFSELYFLQKDREEMRTESVYYVQHRNKRSVLLIRSWLLPETRHSEHIRPAWK